MTVHIPPMTVDKKIERQLAVSVTHEERVELQKKCSKLGVSVSNYIRKKLGLEPVSRIKQTMISHPNSKNRIILEG